MISWFLKAPVSDVKLKLTDAAGREVREISGPVLANSNKAGIQSACWDLRVQPTPTSPVGRGSRGANESAGGQGAAGRSQTPAAPSSTFGAGCGGPAVAGAIGGAEGNAANDGPFVLAGVYNVALIVDGKTVDTKPLHVVEDPEVVLTTVERKRQFDMAMEMHELQRPGNEAAAAHASLIRQMTDLAKTIAGRSDIPADVKGSFESVNKELVSLGPKFAQPAGRGGGGRGGAPDSLLVKIATAKGWFDRRDEARRADDARISGVEGADVEGDRRHERGDRQGDSTGQRTGKIQSDVDRAAAREGIRACGSEANGQCEASIVSSNESERGRISKMRKFDG